MFVRFLLVSLLMISPLVSFANGVERGSIREAIQKSDEEMSGDLLDFVTDAIVAKCSLENASLENVSVVKSKTEIDQGVVDFFYRIEFTFVIEGQSEREVVSMEVAQYAISNPAIPNMEVLSISSRSCK